MQPITLSLLPHPATKPLWQIRDDLLARLRELGECLVAFSGGVDSAVILKAAYLAVGRRCIAVTAVSDSLAQRERHAAIALAQRIGVRHEILQTNELSQLAYTRNAHDRCYHCKTELYVHMSAAAQRWQSQHLVNGTNADDLGDYRPGLQAGREHQVHSPLAELGYGKLVVRQLAAAWNLPVWDKPASPCLSSRIVYGLSVTPARLARIDQAESYLIDRGFSVVRVRHLDDDTARIEVPLPQLPRLVEATLLADCTAHFRKLGFRRIWIDAEGFRSGNLNESPATSS